VLDGAENRDGDGAYDGADEGQGHRPAASLKPLIAG
jgi:hypothetical protein